MNPKCSKELPKNLDLIRPFSMAIISKEIVNSTPTEKTTSKKSIKLKLKTYSKKVS